MSDSAPPPPNYGGHPFPPPPPPSPEKKGMSGCLKWGLIGCGGLVLLVVLLMVAGGLWFSRNKDAIAGAAVGAGQEGARVGLGTDEAGCVEEGVARGGDALSVRAGIATGTFVRSCLEFSRETPGFCDDVPPPTAIRRTVTWKQERCGDELVCPNVLTVVQNYCTDGRTKRTAADTLGWFADEAADTLGADRF